MWQKAAIDAGRAALATFAPSILKPAASRASGQVAREVLGSVATSVAPNVALSGLAAALGPGEMEDKVDSFLAFGPTSAAFGLLGRAGTAGALGALSGGKTARLAADFGKHKRPGGPGSGALQFVGQHAPMVGDFTADFLGGSVAFEAMARDNASMQLPAHLAGAGATAGQPAGAGQAATRADAAIAREIEMRRQLAAQAAQETQAAPAPLGSSLDSTLLAGLDPTDPYVQQVAALLSS